MVTFTKSVKEAPGDELRLRGARNIEAPVRRVVHDIMVLTSAYRDSQRYR